MDKDELEQLIKRWRKKADLLLSKMSSHDRAVSIHSCADELEKLLKSDKSDYDETKTEAKKIYDDLINEFSGVGGVTGYEAPLGSNPAHSNEKDVYAGHRSKKGATRLVDGDNKIRNAGSENVRPYLKTHPINSKPNVLKKK